MTQEAQNVGDDILDLWRLDPGGLLVSHATGSCLTTFSSFLYGTCTANDVWDVARGQLQSTWNNTCLGPLLSRHSAEGYELGFVDCGVSPQWSVEKSSLVVYPIPEESWRQYASQKYKVSVS